MSDGARSRLTERVIKVRQHSAGWSVECALSGQPMMFLAADRAEAQARALARRLASTGPDVQVTVHGEQYQLLGTARYFGDDGYQDPATR